MTNFQGCGGIGTCAIGLADLDCSLCEQILRLDAIEAHAQGDYEIERRRLDTLALIERRRLTSGDVPGRAANSRAAARTCPRRSNTPAPRPGWPGAFAPPCHRGFRS